MNSPTSTPDIMTVKQKGFHPKRFLKSLQQKLYTSDSLYLLFCFLVPVAIMYVIYVIFWISLDVGFSMAGQEYGGGTPLVLDLNAQYVYFFEALRKFVYGDASLLYSFGRTLGGEFMGMYAYYLASPLSYIVALFPAEYMQEAILTIILLKTGLCGLSFGFFLHKHSKTPNKLAVFIFSMLYSLSAFAVVHQSNTMWFDAMIWLPIFTLALERLITHRKFKLYVISLSAILISNYYIGYMVCIFAVLYFFYYYFSKSSQEINPSKERLHFLRAGSRFAVFSLLSAAISAFMLIPAYYSLGFGKTTFSNPSWALKSNFDIFDFVVKLLPGSFDTVGYPGLPFVYCGVITLLLLPIYFTSKNISLREKLASGGLVAVFLLSFILNPLDLIWHGFSQPNWLNARYSFIFCFFILILAYKGFGNLKRTSDKFILGICGFLVLLAAIAEKCNLESFVNVNQTFELGSMSFDGKTLWTFGCVWFSVIFIIALGVLLCSRIRINTQKARTAVTSIIAAVVCAELLLNGIVCILWFDEDVVFSNYDGYKNYLSEIRPIISQVEAQDNGFYRMEKTFHRTCNDNMALGLKGISNSTSTLNQSAITFIEQLGYTANGHMTEYEGGTPFTDSLLGIKYVIGKQLSENCDSPSSLYDKLTDIEDEKYTVYNNPYAMSIAFGVNDLVKDFELVNEKGYNVHDSFFERYNYMLSALLGSEQNSEMFKTVYFNEVVPMNFVQSEIINYNHQTITTKEDSKGTLAITHTAPYTGHYYFYAPISSAKNKALPTMKLEFNERYVGEYLGEGAHYVMYVGYFEEGQDINVFITIPEDSEVIFNSHFNYLWYFDESVYESAMTTLSDGPQFDISPKSTDDNLFGTIKTSSTNQMIMTTIPYDEGWKVFVDGAQTEIYKIFDSLMAFDISDAGEHTLTLKYDPDCYHLGYTVSLIGIIGFIILCAAEFILRKTILKNKATEDLGDFWVLEDTELEATPLPLQKDSSKETDCTNTNDNS